MTAPPVQVESEGGPAQPVRPVETVGYNAYGEVVATTDPNGNTTRVSHDSLGRPVDVTAPTYTPPGASEPITSVTHTTYDPLGNITEITDPLGHTTRFGYDQLNRLTI